MKSIAKIPNKRKIINDPVYGFIKITSDLLFDIIEHPYFQRLRRIHQLGLTYLVYPGANHNRFQHVLGAAYLMKLAIEVLQSKGHEITKEEEEGALIAILLHDIGHSPFSHTLEHFFVKDLTHEDISLLFMQELNGIFDGQLETGIKIFQNRYEKKFLHQLVSSQLDMDRLDYLRRDSFFTGVSEGVVGSDRIIKMLNVWDDNLVVDAKGIYSIEKFIIARRLMYWQVYLHKTVVAAEEMLIKTLSRARQLLLEGKDLFTTPALHFFLSKEIDKDEFLSPNPHYCKGVSPKYIGLSYFTNLDDNDIMASIKTWTTHSDRILSTLSRSLINRKLPGITIQKEPFKRSEINRIRQKTAEKLKLPDTEVGYFVFSDVLKNNAYRVGSENINILFPNNEVYDIAKASDVSNVKALTKTVTKYFLCYPKEIVRNQDDKNSYLNQS